MKIPNPIKATENPKSTGLRSMLCFLFELSEKYIDERINNRPIPFGSGIKVPHTSNTGEIAPNEKPKYKGKSVRNFTGRFLTNLLSGR
jgi:hypothetical protein